MLLKRFFREIDKYPRINHKTLIELARKAKAGDIEARNRIIEANLPLVVRFAMLCSRGGVDLEDLISFGNIGLINAVQNFNPNSGWKFSTIATPFIIGAILRGIDNESRTIRVPVSNLALQRKILKLKSQQGVAEQDTPKQQMVSLDEPLKDGDGHSGRTYADRLLFEQGKFRPSALQYLIIGERIRIVRRTITVCIENKRNRKIFMLRYGLTKNRSPMTFREIAKMYRLTATAIRCIVKKDYQRVVSKLPGLVKNPNYFYNRQNAISRGT